MCFGFFFLVRFLSSVMQEIIFLFFKFLKGRYCLELMEILFGFLIFLIFFVKLFYYFCNMLEKQRKWIYRIVFGIDIQWYKNFLIRNFLEKKIVFLGNLFCFVFVVSYLKVGRGIFIQFLLLFVLVNKIYFYYFLGFFLNIRVQKYFFQSLLFLVFKCDL